VYRCRGTGPDANMSALRTAAVSRETLSLERRWRTVLFVGLVMVLGSVIPSPLGRHPEFRYVGPDKLLHLLGHAGFTTALADALVADGVDDRTACWLAVGGSVSLGLGVGYLQRYVPGRMPERADLAAGLVGSIWSIARRRPFKNSTR